MPRKKVIHFALLGLGKLGCGFYKIWEEKREKIKEETGFDLNLKKILIKNSRFKRPGYINTDLLTDNPEDIANDKDIHIAIDAIGGIEPTFSIIKKLINSKISIVSANRSLLASKMHQIADLANENNIYIMPEPSLGGGVPIISAIQRDLLANRVRSLVGILSGTSNYILSEMSRRQISLEQVLKLPRIQKMGESLSIIDYEGSDAAQKISILAAGAFGIDINFLHIHAEGISDISADDIRHAGAFGYEFKLLAILIDHEDAFELRVHPTLVPKDHPLALVKGEYNAYYLETDLLGNYMIYGKGVGIEATSSLLLRDIVGMANLMFHSASKDRYRLDWNEKPIRPIEDIECSYYLRFPCIDKPGVIGKITSMLGEYNINIGSAHAEVDKTHASHLGFVHILVDQALERDIKDALNEIEKSDFIKDRIKFFRILREA